MNRKILVYFTAVDTDIKGLDNVNAFVKDDFNSPSCMKEDSSGMSLSAQNPL